MIFNEKEMSAHTIDPEPIRVQKCPAAREGSFVCTRRINAKTTVSCVHPSVEYMDNVEIPKNLTPGKLYDILTGIWCEYTCAPRLRKGWSSKNMTLGQCSITAFLVQDIFGGEVYGILRPGGNYHCYNAVGDCVFDLTSEQFGDEVLNYDDNPIQLREVHFAKEEKRLRYEYLKKELEHYFRENIDKNCKN